MKTYDTILRNTDGGVLVDDGGNSPALGETVTIAGALYEVTASNNELMNDSGTGGRFIATRKP